MSTFGYAPAPLRRWTREEIFKDEDTLIEYLKQMNAGKLFLLSGAFIGSKVANYLLSLIYKDEKVNEEAVKYWIGVLENGRFYYYGGHSCIHIDQEGHILDWMEKLVAIARCGITDRKKMPMANIHFGILPFLRSVIRANETPIAPVQAFTSLPATVDNRPPVRVAPIIVKEPEYVMKYPYKSITLIQAYLKGVMKEHITEKAQFSRLDAIEWCKKNDNPMLARRVKKNYSGFTEVAIKFLHPAEWQAVKYITSLVDEDDSNAFFDLVSGNGQYNPSHPITALRNKFSSMSSYTHKDSLKRLALAIIAWNAYRTKGGLTILEWDQTKEEFPKAI